VLPGWRAARADACARAVARTGLGQERHAHEGLAAQAPTTRTQSLWAQPTQLGPTTMEAIAWTIDWNPEFRDDAKLKREVLKCFRDLRIIRTIRDFAERSMKEASEDGLETEHILWLDASYRYALFVRVWYEAAEEKLFIIIEENDLGDVGFFLLDTFPCATYEEERVVKVEYNEKFRDPGAMGVPR
jgi:hypothetical protein